jgi:2'-5' RNA ligase
VPAVHGSAPTALRLFVAVELPGGVRDALARTLDALQHDLHDATALRWVRPEAIHITLKFLGAVDPVRLPAVHTALRIGVRAAQPLELVPDAIGSFGGRRNLRVVWLGVGGDLSALTALAADVDAALGPLGFPREQRPFSAHLTLARSRDEAPAAVREQIFGMLAAFDPPAIPAFRVASVSLMRSTLGRGGAVYERIGAYPLDGGSLS